MSDIHQKRIKTITEMLLDSPDDTFLRFALAKEYDAIGEVLKSIEQYKNVLELDKNYIGAYYHQAELLNRSGNTNEAIELAEQGVQIAQGLGSQKELAELIQLIESF